MEPVKPCQDENPILTTYFRMFFGSVNSFQIPISRKNFWDLINELSSSGITVFVTTHYLDEAEFCNRIMMIDAGKLIAGGSPGELKKKYLNNPIIEIGYLVKFDEHRPDLWLHRKEIKRRL